MVAAEYLYEYAGCMLVLVVTHEWNTVVWVVLVMVRCKRANGANRQGACAW